MKCKNFVVGMICVVLLTALFLPTMVFAEKQEQFTLRVGYWPGYGIIKNKNGQFSGYTCDYMKEITKINNWKVEYIPCDWKEGQELLKEGKLDVFGPMEKTEERIKLYDYTNRSMGQEDGGIYAAEDNNAIFYEDADSIDGKKLGTIEGNSFIKNMSNYCEKNNISIKNVYMNNAAELSEALDKGSIDLRASGSMQFPENSRIVLRFQSEEFYYPTTKGNEFVLNGMNKALELIQKENPFYNIQLYQKHYGEFTAEKKAFTVAEAEYIKKAPVLYVGYEATGKPIEYYDQKTRSAKGISIDLLKEVSKYSGLKFAFIPTYSLGQALEMIKSNKIQLVSGLVSCDDFNELYNLEPTKPLMESSLVFITKQGKDFNANKPTMSLPSKWVGIRNHIRDNYPEIRIESYPDAKSCLKAVKNEEVNMTVMNTYAVDNILKGYSYRGLTVNEMRKGTTSICLGTALDANPVLRSIIDKSIASLDDGFRNQIVYKNTMGFKHGMTFSEIIVYNWPIFLIVILLFLFILYLFSLQSRKKLNALAYRDPLTGEMNLNKFKLEAQKLINHNDKTYALMVIDVDKFKSINDLYGYEFGDKMLILLANTLRRFLRSDTLLGRGSADKFYLFFEFADKEWFGKRFKELVLKISSELSQKMSNCHIIISGGVCIVKHDDHNIISIIDRANIASKQVKSYHESYFAYYDQSMYDKLNETRTIENNMSASLNNEEFIVYLQPKVDPKARQIAGAEALVRWEHPEKGLISPMDFIPLFEENGFIVNLDFYMLNQVCKFLERWKKEGRQLFTVSVNLSRRHLFNADTARLLKDIVLKYDVEPHLIEVELTESAFDNCDISAINTLFDALHDCGFTVSVDDFGAGYSSLALLKDLPIDVLKIDKSFFEEHKLGETRNIEILLESVITLSRKLNIKTVSEGVETKKQVDLLVRLGCDLVQGFYFAKPMPVCELEKLIDDNHQFI